MLLLCIYMNVYYYYYVFILSAISPYTTGLKALFNQGYFKLLNILSQYITMACILCTFTVSDIKFRNKMQSHISTVTFGTAIKSLCFISIYIHICKPLLQGDMLFFNLQSLRSHGVLFSPMMSK